MSDRTYLSGFSDRKRALLKGRVKKLADKWIKPIGLGWWTIHINYYDDIADTNVSDGVSSVGMDVVPNWKYMEATIRVNLTNVDKLDDDTLEYMFVHELMHIFVNEMREYQNSENPINHEERVCTQLAKAMLWAVENIKKESQ